MIRSGKVKDKPSKHIQDRAAKMKVERLGPTKFRVIPEPGKRVRIVEFFLGDGDCGIDCYAEATSEGCQANDHNRRCAHVEAVLKVLLSED